METIKHGLISALKGTKKKDHKYIERTGSPGHYKYIYELKDNVKKGITNATDKVKKGITNAADKWKDGWTTIADASKKYTSDFIKNFGDMTVNDILSTATANLSRAHIQNFLSTSVSKISSLGSGWLKKGQAKLGHKWIKRFGTPGNYTYIYPKVINSFKKLVNTNIDELNVMGAVPNWVSNRHEEKQSSDITLAMIQEDIRNINDEQYYNVDHPDEGYSRNRNCGYCSIAYDMRRRGYDVQATPGDGISGIDLARIYGVYSPDDEPELFGKNTASDPYQNPYSPYAFYRYTDGLVGRTSVNLKSWESVYKKVHMEDNYKIAYIHGLNDVEIDSAGGADSPYPIVFSPSASGHHGEYLTESEYKGIEKKALKFGNGARGIINMYYDADGDGAVDGAHAQAWENVNGKFTIIDAQTGKMSQGYKDVESNNLTLMYSCYASILRTDNLVPNIDAVSNYVEDAKRGKYYKESQTIDKDPKYNNYHYAYKTQEARPVKKHTHAVKKNTHVLPPTPKDTYDVNEFIQDAAILGVPYATAKQMWDMSHWDTYHVGEWLIDYILYNW